MGLDLLVTTNNGDQELYHLCSEGTYRAVGKPACADLKLDVAAIVGGLTTIEEPFRERLLLELAVLLKWLEEHIDDSVYHRQLAINLKAVLDVIQRNLSLGNEVSFC